MPNCFTLTRKGETSPTTFVRIDEEICAHLGVPCDPVRWHRSWYDIVGLALACGESFERIRSMLVQQESEGLIPIVDFLAENFTPDAWYSR